jgi:hypothetical protein
MSQKVITIEEPRGPRERARGWLQGRRIVISGGLALAEVFFYLLIDPGRWLSIIIVGAVLAGAIAWMPRVKRGFGRDVLLVIALAQAIVLALPILDGIVKLAIAAIATLALIALFILIGLRFRR